MICKIPIGNSITQVSNNFALGKVPEKMRDYVAGFSWVCGGHKFLGWNEFRFGDSTGMSFVATFAPACAFTFFAMLGLVNVLLPKTQLIDKTWVLYFFGCFSTTKTVLAQYLAYATMFLFFQAIFVVEYAFKKMQAMVFG